MATYYTERELLARAGSMTASGAAEALRRSEKSAIGVFDVFLSHSVRDARIILGLKNMLEQSGLRVYVDWIEDPQLDRSNVSPATADRLRQQMRKSRSLIYATSRSARESKWMPWELGYFDGLQDGERISILPIDTASGDGAFAGQEYLGLYKVIQKVPSVFGTMEPYAVAPSGRRGETLASFARGARRYENLERR